MGGDAFKNDFIFKVARGEFRCQVGARKATVECIWEGAFFLFYFFQPFARLFGNSEGSLNPKYCTEARA